MLAVSEGGEHVVSIIPLEAVYHVADFVELRGVNLCHKHVAVAVHETQLAFGWDLNLVELHLDDVGSMLNHFPSLARVNVEGMDLLGVTRVDDSNHVGCYGQVSLAEELNSEPLHGGLAHQFAFITVDIEVLGSVDDGEEFGALHNHVDVVFQVKDERRSPVLRLEGVDVALRGGANDHIAVLHAHVYDALSKVKFFA